MAQIKTLTSSSARFLNDYAAGTYRLDSSGNVKSPIACMQEDFLNRTGAYGNSSLSVNQPLPPEAGKELDLLVTEVGSQRLAVADLLIQFGTRPLANWWATPSQEYEKLSTQGRATQTMEPGGATEVSMADREAVQVAIFALEEGFSFHRRLLMTAARSNVSLPTDSLFQAVRNISEALEDITINGPVTNFNGIQNFGLENAPDANSVQWSGANPSWIDPSKTGKEIQADYFAMRTAAFEDLHFGPFALVHELRYEEALDRFYTDGVTTQTRTVREVLLSDSNLVDIRVADQLAPDRASLIELQPTTCGMYVGQGTTWLAFPEERMQNPFLALACMVPYFRSDKEGGSGIVNGNVP